MPVDSKSFFGPVELSDEASVAKICLLRAQVWRDTGNLAESAFASEGWRDAIDSHCRHWAILNQHQMPVAAGRLSLHASLDDVHESHEYRRYGIDFAGGYANPDRVVVDRACKGCGLGRQILDAQDNAIDSETVSFSVRQASPAMVRLLIHRGWYVAGPASSDSRFRDVQFSVVIKPLRDEIEQSPMFQDWLSQRKVAA
jgi:hypothetical protein